MLTFSLYMSQLEKLVIPKMKDRLKDYNFQHEDIVYLYDNATSHCGGWSGWWMRGAIKGFKITIPPFHS